MNRLHWVPICILLVLSVYKIILAALIPLHGDEAFYWLESRHLAWIYSDLPPMTAWVIRAGDFLFGHGLLGVRSLFLVPGCALPILVWLLTRQVFDRTHAWVAMGISLALPLVVLQGMMAFPDVLLNLWIVSGLLCVVLAIKHDRLVWWVAAGLLAAAGWLTHYRFAVPVFALALFFVMTADGRRLLYRPGPWLLSLLSLLGLIPLVILNFGSELAGAQFQLVDRHPWSFQLGGLLWIVEQLVVTGPVLFVLLVLSVWRLRGSLNLEQRLLAWTGSGILLVYALVGFWADRDRTLFHWPFPGYLLLAPLLSHWLIGRWQAWQRPLQRLPLLGFGFVLPIVITLYGVSFWLHLSQNPQTEVSNGDLFPDNALGWPQVTERASELVRPGDQIIADNFMLAAELGFGLKNGRIVSLHHPLNVKHGRAAQLSWLQLDESAIRQGAAILIVEASATPLIDRPEFFRTICERFPGLSLVDQMDLFAARKRFLFYQGDTSAGAPDHCDVPSISYLDQPVRDAVLSGSIEVSGWAFDDDDGVASVEIMINGKQRFPASYGHALSGVKGLFQGSTDPNHPNVGFRLTLPAGTLIPGRHELVWIVTSKNGGVRRSRPQWFTTT